MATKKEVTEKKVVDKAVDEDLVEVFIPYDPSNPDEENEYVAVNGVAILIPKGRKVKVKRQYAEAVKHTEGMRDYMRQKDAEARRKADSQNVNTTY